MDETTKNIQENNSMSMPPPTINTPILISPKYTTTASSPSPTTTKNPLIAATSTSNPGTKQHQQPHKQPHKQQQQQQQQQPQNNNINYYKNLPCHTLPPEKCPLLCVFYSEFDNIVGPKICFQSPKQFMDQDITAMLNVDKIHTLLSETFSEIKCKSNRYKGKNDGGISSSDGEVEFPYLPDMNKVTTASTTKSSAASNNNTETTTTATTTSSSATNPNHGMSIFDATSEYIITGQELANQIISLSTHNMHILSRPTILHSKQYERNSLLFSVGFIIRRQENKRIFCPILSKLATMFYDMEIESHFLSNENKRNHDEDSGSRIQCILECLLVSLNSPRGECNLALNEANALHVKLFQQPKSRHVPPILDYVVPVLLLPEWQIQMFDWDLTINWIVPHINGLKYTRLIAQSSEVDMEMVRACLRVLKHHGVIAFMDIFQYSNVYECTSYGGEVLCCAERGNRVVSDALAFVLKSGGGKSRHNSLHNSTTTAQAQHSNCSNTDIYPTSIMLDPSSSSNIPPLSSTPTPPKNTLLPNQQTPPPPFQTRNRTASNTHDILSISEAKTKEHRLLKSILKDLYTSFNRNTTFGEVLLDKWRTEFEMFDHRRFVTFGVLNGWIRRIHCFPIVFYNTILNDDVVDADPLLQQIVSFMDGTKCDDELSCFFQTPFGKLIDLVKLDGTRDVCFIYRE